MSDDDNKFVTLDAKLKDAAPGLHPVDVQVLKEAQAGEGVALTAENIQRLAKAAKETHDTFTATATAMVDQLPGLAERVRKARVNDGVSWRGVAQEIYDLVSTTIDPALIPWSPPSNQLMGMALCEAAAKKLGEDYMKEPWN